MADRLDLLIAVIGIVVSILGSSTALWLSLSKKADKDDVARLESRLEAKIDGVEGRLEAKIDGVEGRLEAKIDGVEGRLEAKIEGLERRLDARIDGAEGSFSAGLSRVESKLDGLILRLVPEQLPRPEN